MHRRSEGQDFAEKLTAMKLRLAAEIAAAPDGLERAALSLKLKQIENVVQMNGWFNANLQAPN